MYFDDSVIEGYHPEPARFRLWMELSNRSAHDLSDLHRLCEIEQELFLGEYSSTADYAEEILGNLFMEELEDLPNVIKNHINWADIWDRELRFEHDYNETPDWTFQIWAQH